MSDISKDDLDSIAMAEVMGFTDFGGPFKKKRKFNPCANASSSGSLPPKPPAPAHTGANNTALGERRRPISVLPPPRAVDLPMNLPMPRYTTEEEEVEAEGSQGAGGGASGVHGGNADEINLDDDDDDGEVPSGPQYIDTSRPHRPLSDDEAEAKEMQERIDAILARITTTTGEAADTAIFEDIPGVSTADAADTRAAPNQGTGEYRWSGGHPDRRNHAAKRGGDDGGLPWWQGYVDPKFNENPWERLEKEKGLEPMGSWIPRRTTAAAKSG